METGPGYKGKRLYLSKIREEQDTDLLYALRRWAYPAELEKKEVPRFLVFFMVQKILPVIGAGDDEENFRTRELVLAPGMIT